MVEEHKRQGRQSARPSGRVEDPRRNQIAIDTEADFSDQIGRAPYPGQRPFKSPATKAHGGR
jgi:hypothetical protein